MSTTKWIIDPTHSEVGFKIKHLMITNVSGSFGKFSVEAEANEDDFQNALINFTAEVSSINTGNEQRDGHIQSADFFDAAKFSEIKFRATNKNKPDEDGNFIMEGDLTIRDVTKPVKINVDMGGVTKDSYGNIKAGFTVSGKLNRKDFGIAWNASTETGTVVLSDEVRFNAEIQLVKQINVKLAIEEIA